MMRSPVCVRSLALIVCVGLGVSVDCAVGIATPVALPVTALKRQPIARGLYELVYSPSQDAVFVASSGGFGEDAGPSQILRLDPATLAVQGRIALQRKAFGVALDDANGRLYVGNTFDSSVTVVDTTANTPIGTVQLMDKGGGKHAAGSTSKLRELVVDSIHHRLYVSGHSEAGGVLFVVDTRSLKQVASIAGLGQAKTLGLTLDHVGKRLYTSNLRGEVVVVNAGSGKVERCYKVSAEQPMNLALDPAGGRLFITDQGLDIVRKYQAKSIPGFVSRHPGKRVLVVDPMTGKEMASFPTGAGPLALLLDASRNRLYVTNRKAGTVTAYDSNRYTQVGRWSVPAHPNSLALDARRNVLYVSVKNDEAAPRNTAESVVRIQL